MDQHPNSVTQSLFRPDDCFNFALKCLHLVVTYLGTYSGSFDFTADWCVTSYVGKYPNFVLAEDGIIISSITAFTLDPRPDRTLMLDAFCLYFHSCYPLVINE